MKYPYRSLVALLAASVAAAGTPTGPEAIRALEARQADAWNHHDANAYAALFTPGGDTVNVLGWWWRGRSEIAARLAEAFAWVFQQSILTIEDVQVRMVSPTLAIAHVRWSMAGARVPPGASQEPQHGIQLQVLRKLRGAWLIESFQNTNAIPEVPFPAGPPGAAAPQR